MHLSWLPPALLTHALLFSLALGQDATTTEIGGDNDGDFVTAPSTLSSTVAAEPTDSEVPTTSGGAEVSPTDSEVPTSASATEPAPIETQVPPSLAPADCHCGFLDPLTTRTYTDSLVVYFNETETVPSDFALGDFAHKYERGYLVYYLQGASPSNAFWSNGSTWNLSPGWLNLNVTGFRVDNHLVSGAELKTKRQDIQYGSFRMLAKPAAPYASGGSALTMRLMHNESSSAELDLLNMDDSGNTARFATTVNSLAPDPANCLNYTILLDDNAGYNADWWNFWEYRMDWSVDGFEWYVGPVKTRTLAATNWTMPMSLEIKHWSNGDPAYMQGPPANTSGAALGWVRSFFNSSLSTELGMPADCSVDMLCSTEDTTLRLTSTYPDQAMESYEELHAVNRDNKPSIAAIALAIASVALTAVLFAFGFTRRAVRRKDVSRPAMHKAHQSDMELTRLSGSNDGKEGGDIATPRKVRPELQQHVTAGSTQPLLAQRGSYAANALQWDVLPTPYDDARQYPDGTSTSTLGQSGAFPGGAATSTHSSARYSGTTAWTPAVSTSDINIAYAAQPDHREKGVHVAGHNVATEEAAGLAGANPGAHDAARAVETIDPTAKSAVAAPVKRQRVDYLAGLVALCSILVSVTHWVLTYTPSVIMEYLPAHYNSEQWARRTIEPFLMNDIWVGLFFTTSTRFLTTAYLRKADLKIIAEKTVSRTPRLMIPIAAVIVFEYFLMDVGAVKYLEYVPSITWSTWPSTWVYPNFGWFISETLQLIYLIPNAAPQLTWNFCTGVLWTIPVQLQNTWLVLLGAVVITEIKTPWKRFGYYAFCVVNHWYALSWGSYFWFGLLLADLDITYKYRTKIQSSPLLLYPLLTAASLLVFVSLGNDLLSVWTGYTFSTKERSIHPEIQSGLNIGATPFAAYPEYTEPKLNGLVFCVASQFIVEISVWTQKFLSTKPFLLLFPHVFTMYLIHGLVFWSIGSLVCVWFADLGLAYWLNMLLTAIICYVALFACLPIVTPAIEMLGKEMTKSIWVGASQEPDEWRPTSWPLGRDEVEGKRGDERRRDGAREGRPLG
ncbi:hypothetical protein B0A48_11197 [Cryoendolithus antarcticus]|uniref:GH16 domain-containing protein n=1 Tax=Cryoendolithus antarcticus TaxID=1507870 RepID=A0A1V8SV35_9PEZI|nr:hypothetical protein B0A48_11197 [Cryoendolithus antarcticus]